MKRLFTLSLMASAITLSACGGGSSGTTQAPPTNTPTPTTPAQPAPTDPPPPTVNTTDTLIKVNQVGYLPSANKIAVVPDNQAREFSVVNTANDTVVMSGTLSDAQTWAEADQSVRLADFSQLNIEGEYVIRVEGVADSLPIKINDNAYLSAHDAALKAYYFNRASTELLVEHAGEWRRPAGHPDTNVRVHASAASATRPEGTVISAPKGWYDAGDFNKYIVNSGISTYTLLAAYERFTDFYATRDIGIPESGNTSPDLLDEIKWNLDWMLAMQDPTDGGVYHKLTTLRFAGTRMPHEATAQRYVVQKGTGAALNFAAVMATASRVYGSLAGMSDLAAQYRQAAVLAWQWAQDNDNVVYRQPSDVQTGEYGDSRFDDEFTWASAELYLLTEEAQYLTSFKQYFAQPRTPFWQETAALGYMSLLQHGETLLSNADYTEIQTRFTALADSIVDQHQASAYSVAMTQNDFVWGSNSVALNKAMILLAQNSHVSDAKYKTAASNLVDYILGKNPTDYSFVTGNGVKTPMDPHHRQSAADTVAAPIPGFVVGGPQPGRQDNCSYPSNLPATTYLDDYCSFSTNEVTINWNAPFVFATAALQSSN
jgi:endoglucanase